MKIIPKIAKIEYSIILDQVEAEELLEYLDADSSPCRQDELCNLLHSAGARTPSGRMHDAKIKLDKDALQLYGENYG